MSGLPREYVHLSEDDLAALLENAANKGAELALERVGLSDENAGRDVRDLRTLIESYRTAKKAAFDQFVRWVVIGLLGAIMLGLFATYGIRK